MSHITSENKSNMKPNHNNHPDPDFTLILIAAQPRFVKWAENQIVVVAKSRTPFQMFQLLFTVNIFLDFFKNFSKLAEF